jgi:RNA polymerase sigma-70 factor, ECF subfamily
MNSFEQNQRGNFEALLRPHLDRLYRLAFRLAGNKAEAEDLFQDVLTKVFPRLDDLIEVDQPGSWLCRIMYNHFIDDKRRFSRQRLVLVPEHQLPGEDIESQPGKRDPVLDAEQHDDIMRLDKALNSLSDEHRLVVMLHDCEGYKLSEIEELTSVPIGTLKSRLHRARERLRGILNEDGTKTAD